ncbi:MAG: ATP phosphoribosyltransferase [Oscillospiraceae bacterium]|nr:ATP phosphoribosyltransferase [Oscillospiraceae bacterium]
MLNIALPKGRLGERVYRMLKQAGYDCPELENPDRRLVFENHVAGVRYFWVKPSDVTIYVERGAADLGIAGKDILLENRPDLYELLDLRTGICRMAVAGPSGFRDSRERTLLVATKFPNIAGQYYSEQSREVELIKLNGSIEIAPILGLSDVIVDIVETGKTLKENGLVVLETVCPISARLVANPSAYRFRREEILRLVRCLSAVLPPEKPE